MSKTHFTEVEENSLRTAITMYKADLLTLKDPSYEQKAEIKVCDKLLNKIKDLPVYWDELTSPCYTMYGWKNGKTGRISMVYDSLKLLQMCSPDHFESRVINKEGNVVELEVYIKGIIK